MTVRDLIISTRESALLGSILADLARAGVPCVPVRAGTEPSAKSAAGPLVSVAVTGLVSAGGLRAMSQVLVAAVRRAGGRRIELRLGDDTLIIDGASPRDTTAALDGFLARAGRDDRAPVLTVDEA
ncbi:hypothetical protein [Actinoplanes sp. NPDC051494]|uniref:hypothetical protein n=1 Tax=Actinoplanes sp. NPDC051494 TaxID=3363907 RepID=UPI0037A944E4